MTTPIHIPAGDTLNVSLCSGSVGAEVALPHVFAILHRLAADTVDSYEGDFYHDALWIHRNVAVHRSFGFSFNESGTSIGTESQVRDRSPENYYLFQLDHTDSSGRDRGPDSWHLHVTRGTF